MALLAQNRVEWPVAQFAAMKAGLVLVNINPASRKDELQTQLNAVDARALITQDSFKSSDYVAMANELLPELAGSEPGELRCEAVPSLEIVVHLGDADAAGMVSFPSLIEQGRGDDRARLAKAQAATAFDAACNIQFSNASGCAAAPATLTHHNILNNGFYCGLTLRLRSGDRVCVPVPLFHSFGMVMGNMTCLAHGATMVYPDETFDPGATLKVLNAENCTGVYGVPPMFAAMLDHEEFPSADLSALRTGIMAGAPCPIDLMHRVVDDMGMPDVVIGYGMTESSPVSFMCDVDDKLETRVSTVGTIRPHTEAKVVNNEGQIAARGEVGELCVRGYNVMRGYWGEPELTARVIDPAGWLHTGDLARIDDHGYCQIAGTAKDMVIRGGENIYLAELRDFFQAWDGVAQVVVFGVPDQRMGEEICACLRLEPGAGLTDEALRGQCQEQISHYKIPRYFRFYTEFPGGSGEDPKPLLRDRVLQELGLD